MTTGMGIGMNLPRHMIVKRRFRWTFEVSSAGGFPITIKPIYCKVAARPSLSFEELEMNFLNERAYLSGKPTWEPLNVTFIDCQMKNTMEGPSKELAKWAHLVYMYGHPDESGQMSSPGEEYKADSALITMYDGCGTRLEHWMLFGIWPQQVNWGDLDYTNNDTADIEVVFRFDNAHQVIGTENFGSHANIENAEVPPGSKGKFENNELSKAVGASNN